MKSSSRRMFQVNELLKQEIGQILLQEMQDPRLVGVSITEVRTSKDLQHARVYVACLGEPEDREETEEALSKGAGHVRRLLGERIRLKYTPELNFVLDDSYDRANRILEILKHVDLGDQTEPSQDGEE